MNEDRFLVEEFIRITSSITKEGELSDILAAILDSALKISRAEYGLVYLLDLHRENLCVETIKHKDMEVEKDNFPQVSLQERSNNLNISAYCAFTGENVHISDIHKAAFTRDEFIEFDKRYNIKSKSIMAVPMRSYDKMTIGVMVLVNSHDADSGKVVEFSPECDKPLRILATQTAVAVQNKQLIESNKRLINILNHNNRQLEAENKYLRSKIETKYDFSKIIGHSKSMQKVFDLMSKVLNSEVTVLVQGETGTGKELIAHAIHYNSSRRNKEFVVQNCAALPENLLESELFGYEKGAFSGANAAKKGLIEVADGGTLFLDEIGDMPISLQAKLLRVLQEKEVRRLGSVKSMKVNVRIVAATHCDLKSKIEEGSFREDLYYRLSVFPIELPALRDRKEDLPPILQHFLDGFNSVYKKDIKTFSPKTLEILTAYDFPGNIRELRNEVERALLLAEEGGSILPEHLSEFLLQKSKHNGSASKHNNVEKVILDIDGGLKEVVGEYEAKVITNVLEDCDWNQTRAAQILGIGRRTLITKINRYQIGKPI